MAISSAIPRISAFIIGISLFCQVSADLTITTNQDPPAPGGNPTYIMRGERLTLTCTSSNPAAALKWVWQDSTDNSILDVGLMNGVSVGNAGEITIASVSGKIGGNYTCTDGKEQKAYWVNVLDSDSLIPHDVTTNGTEDKVSLSCDQRFDRDHRLPLIWTYKVFNATANQWAQVILNNPPTEEKHYQFHGAEKAYNLTIKNPERRRYPQRTGEYACRLNISSLLLDPSKVQGNLKQTDVFEKKVYFESLPDVKIEGVSAARTKSATKGEPLSLQCITNSHHRNVGKVYAIWKFLNTTSNVTTIFNDQHVANLPNCTEEGLQDKKCFNDHVFSTRPLNATADQYEEVTVLEFTEVKDEDHGVYFCEVHEWDGEKETINTAGVTLKVKDKLAALWPFLGIVAEVVVLCAIIFIYEKRRNKTVEEEDENEPMKGEVHETRDNAVRSRK